MGKNIFSMRPPVLTNDVDSTAYETVGQIDRYDASREDLLTMLDNLPVGVILKGRDYRYHYCNEGYARYLGLPREKIIGKCDKDIFDAEVAQRVVDADRCILERTHEKVKTIWNLGDAESGDKWVNVRKRPILDSKGRVSYVLGVMEDIISDNEAQIQMNLRDEELKRAIEAEQKANRAKSDFVSNMSHEMRTPLNAIIGMTQIAQETKDLQKIEYCLKKISVSSSSLLSNINNILDMSKIEAGKLELDHVEFSLENTIKDVCNVISVRANEKNQILRILVGDPYMEEESEYYNLLNGQNVHFTFIKAQSELLRMMENATFAHTPFDVMFFDFDIIKTDGTHIIQQLQRRFGRQKIVLVVAGTQFGEIEQLVGPGEVEKMLPRPLFASSVRQAVDELTGQQIAEPEEMLCQGCAGKRVLLAEDVADNAEILSVFLEKYGIKLSWAQNGQIAVDMFQKAKGEYDLVLMDLQMPVLDGYQASTQIRYIEAEWGGCVPIIAVTANVFREDLDRCLAAGMDDYIIKPLDKDRVIKKISNYLTQEVRDSIFFEGDYFEEDGIQANRTNIDVAQLPLLDFPEGIGRVEGNAVLYTKLLNGFATGKRWAEFEQAWQSGTQKELLAVVHKIKGLAGNLAFVRLKHLLANFEREIDAGRKSAHSHHMVSKCFEETIEQIKSNSRYLRKKRAK